MLQRFLANFIFSAEEILSLCFLAGIGYFLGAGQYDVSLFFAGLFLGQVFLMKQEFVMIVAMLSFCVLGMVGGTMLVVNEYVEEYEVFHALFPALLGFGLTCIFQVGTEFFRAWMSETPRPPSGQRLAGG
jgi:hypothetical protein